MNPTLLDTDPAEAAVSTSPTRARRPRNRQQWRRRGVIYAARLLLLVVLIGGWQLGVNTRHIDSFFWGSPAGAYHQLSVWITTGTAQGSLISQITVTLQEALYGFLIGVLLGVLCGIALGRNVFLSDLFAPFIKVANSIPRIVLGSFFTLAFGYGIKSKVILAVVLVFFGVFFNAFQGTREVDRNLMSNARILGAGRWQTTRQVVLPSAFTWIMASLHISFGFALIGALVGELLGADQGLGLLIKNSQNNTDINGVLAGMVLVALIALIAEMLITLLEKRVLRWRPAQTSADLTVV